jgi:hypothetical protein
VESLRELIDDATMMRRIGLLAVGLLVACGSPEPKAFFERPATGGTQNASGGASAGADGGIVGSGGSDATGGSVAGGGADAGGSGGAGGSIAAGGSAGTAPVPEPISDGLIVLYTFNEGSGTTVRDTSGVAPALDLGLQGTGVNWIDSGLEFAPSGTQAPIAISDGSNSKVIDRLRTSRAMTVELWLQATELDQTGPARVFGVSKDYRERSFSVLHGQGCGGVTSDAAIEVRVRRTTGINGCPPLAVSTTARFTGQVQHLAVTQTATGLQQLYLDTELVGSEQRTDDLSNLVQYPLKIGNETLGDATRAWRGRIFTAAIYERALSVDEIAHNHALGHTAR